jgi:hypothetical protein
MTKTPEEFKLRLAVEVTATAPDVHAAKAALAAHGRKIAGNGEDISLTVESVHVSEKKPKRKKPEGGAPKIERKESHEA